jgi:Zinc carboxypeptidase
MSMRKALILISFFTSTLYSKAQNLQTKFEQSGGRQTATYDETIRYYRLLDKLSPKMQLKEMGQTDAGYPLHLVLFSADGKFDPVTWHKQGKVVILINNGIHPGEPDGIDASMMLLRDLHLGKIRLPENVALGLIPVYNIGGCLNRSSYYRADQNGPEEFGFRGNSQNLDLNRDFIKCDSKDSRSFTGIFQFLDPDIFVDNHVSNGADYQYVMTLLSSQHNKLGGEMGDFLHRTFEPALFRLMNEKGFEMVPYVNVFSEAPENGWTAFFDSPRYGSGYATLWNTFSFVPESHMLKSYDKRVRATYALMECFITFAGKNSDAIKVMRRKAKQSVISQTEFPIEWVVDRSKYSEIVFKGYESGRKPSNISGLPRLYYDQSRPFEKKVRVLDHYQSSMTIKKPIAYIIPQGWWEVIDLLKLNMVKMRQFTKDTTIEVEVYRIEDYKTSARQYEKHHLNSQVKVNSSLQKMNFRKGDYYVPMNQVANRFLLEVLEPQAQDSYFAWNFFDAILGQKEGFSSYTFEDTAEKYLKENTELKTKLEQKRSSDTGFAKNGYAQLDYVFQHSPWYEPDHLRYPVYRVVD